MRFLHTERFLSVDEFSSYCKKLNITLATSELEFYEQAGLVMPFAWVLIPQAYTDYESKRSHSITDEPEPPEWETLDRLLDPPFHEPSWDDNTLLHHLDKPDVESNPHLRRIAPDSSESWPDFEIGRYGKHSYLYPEGSAQPLYHSWQVYQVYLVRRALEQQIHWTSLLGRYLEEGKPEEIARTMRIATRNHSVRNFQGWLHYFDALSFYETLIRNEDTRTFDDAHTVGNTATIAGQEFEDYKQRIKAHAKVTIERFHLDIAKMIEFMIDMLRLRDEIDEDERSTLSLALMEDLEHLRNLMLDGIDKTEQGIEDEIARLGGPWIKKDYRHLVPALRVIDEAKDELEYHRREYANRFPQLPVTEQELNALVDFVVDEGLFVLPFTIATMEREYDSFSGFTQTSMYIGIKNMATGIEDVLRTIGLRKPGAKLRTNTLKPILDEVFKESWMQPWQVEQNRIYKAVPIHGRPTSPSEYTALLELATKDVALQQRPELRIFLLLYWARNLTGHFSTLITEVYFGHLLGDVVEALYDTLFYSWAYARSHQWI
jgi:hypothetical protein